MELEKKPILLPRRVPRQPQPSIGEGGDCAACCLSAVSGIPVEAAYSYLPDARKAFSYPTFVMALNALLHEGKIADLIEDMPSWDIYLRYAPRPFGCPAWLQAPDWSAYIRMALMAGYYPLCEINFAGDGPLSATNHFVMVVGHDVVYPKASGPIDHFLTISCSARGEHRVEVGQFLQRNGGFQAILVLPISS